MLFPNWFAFAVLGVVAPGHDDSVAVLSTPLLVNDRLEQPAQAEARLPVLYTHLHKSAGTSMCALSVLNHEKTKKGSFSNCNAVDSGCSAPPATSTSCAERLAQGREWSYMGVERWADPFLPSECPGLLHAIVIREPLSRIVSNTDYARGLGWTATNEEIMAMLLPHSSVLATANASSTSAHVEACDLIERSGAAYDNFYVRRCESDALPHALLECFSTAASLCSHAAVQLCSSLACLC